MFRPLVATVWALGLCAVALADEAVTETEPSAETKSRSAAVPFVFSTSSMGLSVGGAASLQGVLQEGSQLVGAGAYSENDSHVAFLGVYNLHFGDSGRWFVDLQAFDARFRETQVYLDGNPDFDTPAGGHGSSADNHVLGEEQQRDLYATLRYLLPMGAGKDSPRRRSRIVAGIPVALEKGELPGAYTSIELEPFYREREVIGQDGFQQRDKTQGLSLKLDHDARDFIPSPSEGYRAELQIHRDWGGAERQSYTKWEAQYSHYLNIGASAWSKQQVLAFTAYTSDVPTWDSGSPGSEHRPPWFAESTLGGWNRLRGYQGARFHDRSAVFYGAEYRAIPRWQPQGAIPFIERYYFPWWQFAVYGEVGRVHDSYDLVELHKEMDWTVGVGLRMWVENVVARVDWAFSEEENQLRVVVNQPF
ncbi:BamA/TamA family outer membrane protein [Ferrimonas balearica]|uniref:BamA/TamA family outer membrane protein n=1 Tax=Ferrimonas balearica TaxID=44012 RepID=UPI001C99613D|nr:BamA/TamA family outer membrane protein [Ferrimonas balearica]MBY5993750.1 hypothetical protein [Ferrimonas balearica]